MDYELMKKFYEQMKIPENYSAALSIKTMLEDFIAFRTDLNLQNFSNNHKPFSKPIKVFSNGMSFREMRGMEDKYIKLEIYSQPRNTKILFWIEDPIIECDLIKIILKELNKIQDFEQEKCNKYFKIFSFPDEEDKFNSYLTSLLSLLDENIEKILNKVSDRK